MQDTEPQADGMVQVGLRKFTMDEWTSMERQKEQSRQRLIEEKGADWVASMHKELEAQWEWLIIVGLVTP